MINLAIAMFGGVCFSLLVWGQLRCLYIAGADGLYFFAAGQPLTGVLAAGSLCLFIPFLLED